MKQLNSSKKTMQVYFAMASGGDAAYTAVNIDFLKNTSYDAAQPQPWEDFLP